MARTTHGNLNGQAARTEIADRQAYLLESIFRQDDQTIAANKARFDALQVEMAEWMGVEAFNAWYDDDANIPPKFYYIDMAAIFAKMESKLAELKRGCPAAPGHPASNEQDRGDTAKYTTDPLQYITDGETE